MHAEEKTTLSKRNLLDRKPTQPPKNVSVCGGRPPLAQELHVSPDDIGDVGAVADGFDRRF